MTEFSVDGVFGAGRLAAFAVEDAEKGCRPEGVNLLKRVANIRCEHTVRQRGQPGGQSECEA